MKKSNKILLGGFLAVLLLITAVHLTLYAKYKTGSPVAPGDLQALRDIKFVSVRNVPSATVQFGDVIEVEKGSEDRIQYVRTGDTLHITGRDGLVAAFSLPYNATLSLVNSSLSFQGGKTGGNAVLILLQNSTAVFSGTGSPLQLEQLKVIASGNSTATFVGNTQVNDLEVQLSNSTIVDAEANFGRLSIITDSVSRISLQSKHLLKANIKTITRE